MTSPATLTRRQRQILLLAAAGNTNQHIGHQLGIHHNTVNTILSTARENLGARDRAHAVALAIWYGQITLADLAAIAVPDPQREQAVA